MTSCLDGGGSGGSGGGAEMKIDKLLDKIRCFLGLHVWKLEYVSNRAGFALGDRCQKCGLWSNDSLRRPWPRFGETE